MTLSRKAEWSNSDGLVVGFGNRFPERQATAVSNILGSKQELSMDFTWASTSPALAIPAGFVVESMALVIGTAWVSTGTVTMTIGDGGDADGWFTATELTEANLTAGAIFKSYGAYTQGDDGGAAEPLSAAPAKQYTSADTIDVAVSGSSNAPQTGSARLIVWGYVPAVAAV